VDVQQLERFCRDFKDAAVGLIAELEIGLDGVEALVLQLVGAELGHESDAAAFLLLVDQDAGALFDDAIHGELELLAAVAAQRAEDVAGQALGVDADQRRRGVNVAMHEGDAAFDATECNGIAGTAGLGLGDHTFKAVDAEMSPAGGEVGLRYLTDRDRGHA
jgi:hypothetical protein